MIICEIIILNKYIVVLFCFLSLVWRIYILYQKMFNKFKKIKNKVI